MNANLKTLSLNSHESLFDKYKEIMNFKLKDERITKKLEGKE